MSAGPRPDIKSAFDLINYSDETCLLILGVGVLCGHMLSRRVRITQASRSSGTRNKACNLVLESYVVLTTKKSFSKYQWLSPSRSLQNLEYLLFSAASSITTNNRFPLLLSA